MEKEIEVERIKTIYSVLSWLCYTINYKNESRIKGKCWQQIQWGNKLRWFDPFKTVTDNLTQEVNR